MALNVSNQIFLQMQVDGKEVPVGFGTFQELSICMNTATKLPTLKMVLKDPDNIFHDFVVLGEGSTVGIVLHSDYGFDAGAAYEVKFKIVGAKMRIVGASLVFTCAGIYDSVKFLGSLVDKAYTGNSSDVIRQLGAQCGFIVDAASGTNDSQSWLPSRETFHDFIRNVARHGYVNDKSIMSLGVSDTGTLHYKNLETLAKASATRQVVTGSPDMVELGVLPAAGFEVISMSGLSNFTFNYGTKLIQEVTSGDVLELGKQAMTMFNNFMNIDKGIMDAVKTVRSEYLPPDNENTHKKYFQAENQNRKGIELFSNKIEFVTMNSSGLELYDVVNFKPSLPTNGAISERLSGNYIVTAKTKYLAGSKYAERIRIVSQGFGSSEGQNLLAP